MQLNKLTGLAMITVWLASPAVAEDLSAESILKKVDSAYTEMTSYKSEGEIRSEIDMGERKINQVTTFSILMKKPNLYLISWEQTGGVMTQSGAVWSDGNQPFLYMGTLNAYSKMSSDEMALGGATGISGGAAYTIPSLFLSIFDRGVTASTRLKSAEVGADETVAGEECYVISGPSTISKKETLWISKKTFLVRQYERSLEPPAGGSLVPDLTDEQLEESIKQLGQEPTEANKTRMRETMKRSREMVTKMNLKGSTRETHQQISSPELETSAFKFTLPEGTTEKGSLFGGFLNGK